MKTLTISKKEYQRVGYDEKDIEPIEFVEVKAEYNEAGQITREERYDADGNINTLTVNQYDEQHRLIQSEQFDQDNILLQKTVNIFDGEDLVCQNNFFGEGDDEYATHYIFDENHHVIRHEMYVNGQLDYVEKEIEYEGDRVVKETENDDYGDVMYRNAYAYDAQGRVSRFVRDEIQNKDRRTYEYTYDENGNLVKELVYDYGNALIAKTYRTYNEQNQLVETEEEDLDHYRKIVMEYDGSLVAKNSLYNKEGQLQGWAEYTYDENGKENSSREFIHDEVQPDHFRMLRETFYVRS
jgi:hypothetical protein